MAFNPTLFGKREFIYVVLCVCICLSPVLLNNLNILYMAFCIYKFLESLSSSYTSGVGQQFDYFDYFTYVKGSL